MGNLLDSVKFSCALILLGGGGGDIIQLIVYFLLSTTPSREIRETYAKGIVSVFPSLKDPFSEKGYVSAVCVQPAKVYMLYS